MVDYDEPTGERVKLFLGSNGQVRKTIGRKSEILSLLDSVKAFQWYMDKGIEGAQYDACCVADWIDQIIAVVPPPVPSELHSVFTVGDHEKEKALLVSDDGKLFVRHGEGSTPQPITPKESVQCLERWFTISEEAAEMGASISIGFTEFFLSKWLVVVAADMKGEPAK